MKTNENEALIQSILEKRMQAIHEKDLEAILALYDRDIVTFDFKEPLQNNGIEP